MNHSKTSSLTYVGTYNKLLLLQLFGLIVLYRIILCVLYFMVVTSFFFFWMCNPPRHIVIWIWIDISNHRNCFNNNYNLILYCLTSKIINVHHECCECVSIIVIPLSRVMLCADASHYYVTIGSISCTRTEHNVCHWTGVILMNISTNIFRFLTIIII